MPNPPNITALKNRFFPAIEPSTRLAVVLHGLGDSMEGFYWMPSMLALPRLNYLLVNAPTPYYMGYAWYDIDDMAPGIEKGRTLLQKLLEELSGQGWPLEDLLLFGFSQGCLMSIDLTLRLATPIAGIVGVSGYAFGLEHLDTVMNPQARNQSWLITHGTHDELLPISRTRAQMEQLREAGIPIEWHEYPKGHTIDPLAELPLIRDWIAARWET